MQNIFSDFFLFLTYKKYILLILFYFKYITAFIVFLLLFSTIDYHIHFALTSTISFGSVVQSSRLWMLAKSPLKWNCVTDSIIANSHWSPLDPGLVLPGRCTPVQPCPGVHVLPPSALRRALLQPLGELLPVQVQRGLERLQPLAATVEALLEVISQLQREYIV